MNEKTKGIPLEELSAYEIVEKRRIEDLNSESYLMKHKKTGARIALLSNDDENKVFYVGFRTPPKDSTGVAHILEHCVLCGSKEFPIKDPFVELVKGSLNTFLNAMTYPDKTVYPVASCNDKDFQNLMHVYLDSVFHPNIYDNESIFHQEGWHYELENGNMEGELTINGVVYNEMKGAFSSPDDVLERELMNSLYPDTTYGCESGGDPNAIPELKREQFLDFHRRYYHPSNSYIYLYGNMDMAEKLTFIDEHYLSQFEAITVDSDIAIQAPFEKWKRVVKEYPVNEEEEDGYISLSQTVGSGLDKELYIAFQVIDYALCSAPGAPIKKMLTEKGIGKEIYSIYESGIQQPYFSVIAKNADIEKEEEFLSTIREVLTSIVEKGFDKKALLAGINYFEFKYREADFGSYPKGLMYGLQILDSWLYDDRQPFLYVEISDTFRHLRNKVEERGFEALVDKYLLNNGHGSIVILKPEKGLTEKRELALKDALAKRKAVMGPEEYQEIIAKNKALKEFQEREDSLEDLMKIPLLTRADMKKEAAKLINEERMLGETKVLFHNLFTNGIGYLRLIFKVDRIKGEYLPYLGLLKGVLGLLNTENYKYGDLFNEINMITGGMTAVNNVYSHVDDLSADTFTITLDLKTKVLYANIPKALELMREVLMTSDFTDTKRLYEIIAEGKSRMQAQMMSAGHSMAAGRALSYGSIPGAIDEELSGISFYRLISSLEENFEEKKEEVVRILIELATMIFRSDNLMVDFTGTEEGYEYLKDTIPLLQTKLYTEPRLEWEFYIPKTTRKNEGFMTPGQVQYVCRAGNFRKKGLPYRGDLRVLRVLLGYDYLWTNIRVKGGAYGCMCRFGKTGNSYFVSYRDPNLRKTVDVFENAAEEVANYDADERTMTQYIIGAISELDMPMNPAAKGVFSLSAYMTCITEESLQKERDELLMATPASIRELAEYIRCFMEDDFLCVVGNAGRIREEKQLFLQIQELI